MSGTDWSDEAVAAAFADWVWVPDGSQVWELPGARLIRFPAYLARRMHVVSVAPDVHAAAAFAEVVERCRDVGEQEVRWHVGDGPGTTRLRALLEDHGGTVEETLDQLALTGAPPAHPSEDHVVLPVLDLPAARALDHVEHVVFDEKVAAEERLHDLVAECRAQWEARTDARFVAWQGARPLGCGSLSRSGPALRLWGGATLPEARRQGVYGAVLRARLGLGWEWGTTVALVRGRVDTSAPLLRRTGFRRVGRELSVRLAVPV